MPSAGTTGDLYMNADDTGKPTPPSALGAPPSAPAPVPPPVVPVVVTQPAVTKSRMADETPDGKVRDTSTEALRPGNDLGFRNITDENENRPKTPETETPPPEVPAKQPEPPPALEKLYADRFKTVEETEKGYLEARKEMQKALAERDEYKRKLEAQPPPPPPPKTPEQIALEEAKKNQFLAEFVADPEKVIMEYQRRSTEQTQVALAAQQAAADWRKNNPDLAEHEYFVAAEASRLMQTDPELMKDLPRLMAVATTNYRQIIGKARTEGAKEALTQETRVIPLLSNTAPPANGQPPKETPLSPDDAFNAHIKMLKEQEQRSHRGLRR